MASYTLTYNNGHILTNNDNNNSYSTGSVLGWYFAADDAGNYLMYDPIINTNVAEFNGVTSSNDDIIHNQTTGTIMYSIYNSTNTQQPISNNNDVSVINGNYSTLNIDNNNVYSWSTPNTSCIHPDMIVDATGKKISELTDFPDEHFKELMIFAKTDEFVRIKKDALAENIPSADLLMTPGHPIVFEGKESKASELVNGITIIEEKIEKPVNVYALLFTDARKTVKIHNVDVVQWEEKEWEEFKKNH